VNVLSANKEALAIIWTAQTNGTETVSTRDVLPTILNSANHELITGSTYGRKSVSLPPWLAVASAKSGWTLTK